MMKLSQELTEIMMVFASAMVAVATKLVRASTRPSLPVIAFEVLIGLAFCFIIAPAVQEWYGLSTKIVCALTWAGAYFSGIVLQGAESLLKDYIEKAKPNKNDDNERDSENV